MQVQRNIYGIADKNGGGFVQRWLTLAETSVDND